MMSCILWYLGCVTSACLDLNQRRTYIKVTAKQHTWRRVLMYLNEGIYRVNRERTLKLEADPDPREMSTECSSYASPGTRYSFKPMACKQATTRELRAMYDDEPSSMSLELFGYHGVVVDGDDEDDDTAAALPQLSFVDNFKGGCGSAADYYSWAYNASGGTPGASSSSTSSVLSFEHAGGAGHQLAYNAGTGDDDCALWMDGMADHQHGAARFGFMNPGSADVVPEIQESSIKPSAKPAQKRASSGGEAQAAAKKQCGGGRKSKAKVVPTKDPQSAVAKVRRERISERLKVLQDLVPNGTKVDMVTMLEKAITYVKFLQLQVKVLATDEFWPVQGGKAPELSQVKTALDAILSSQQQP